MKSSSSIVRYGFNDFIDNSYIPKNERDNFDLYECDDIYEDKRQLFYDPEYTTQNSPVMKGKVSYKITESEPCVLSDLVMKITKSEIGYDYSVNDIIRDFSAVTFYVENRPGRQFFNVDITTNLFLAKLLDKKIKEYDDTIEIPIVAFDISKSFKESKYNWGNKFPICLVENSTVTIHLFPIILRNVSFSYRRYNVKSNIDYKNIFYECVCIETDHRKIRANDIFNLWCYDRGSKIRMLLFTCHDHNIMADFDLIEQIQLFSEDREPIYRNDLDGDIIKMKIGKNMCYAISTCSHVKSKKDMIKLFTSDESHNGFNLLNSKMYIKTYNQKNVYNINIVSIETTILRFLNGKKYYFN